MYLMSGHLKHFVETKTRTVKRRGGRAVRKNLGPIAQVVDELVLGHANARVLEVQKGESRKSTSRDSLAPTTSGRVHTGLPRNHVPRNYLSPTSHDKATHSSMVRVELVLSGTILMKKLGLSGH